MTLRVLLVVAGLAVAVWAGLRTADVGACDAAGRLAFQVRTAAQAQRAERQVTATCRGTSLLVAASDVLRAAGHPESARRLTVEAVRREPESAAAWAARRRVALAQRDVRDVLIATERLTALDPRTAATER